MFKYLLLFLLILIAPRTIPQSDFAGGVNGNVNFPNGKFTEYFGTGYGGDAHFLYLFGNSSIFSLSVGYNKFDLDLDAFNAKADELGLDATFDVESSFSTYLFNRCKWYFLNKLKVLHND
jgi:hypothetical protein